MLVEGSKSRNRFLLLYGTATGQAKAICEEIAEKAESFGLQPDLFELDDIGKKFNIERERCVVIVTSTTGDGDPPPTAEKFMRRIRKKVLAPDYLAHFHYALLGLGDSNYSNFNRCARDMNDRLEELGAHKFYDPGFADDGVGLELVADPWLEGLYPALQTFLHLQSTDNPPLSETVAARTDTNGCVHTSDVNKSLEKLSLSSNADGSVKTPLSRTENTTILTNGTAEKPESISPCVDNKSTSISSQTLSDSIGGDLNSSSDKVISDSLPSSSPKDLALVRATNKTQARSNSKGELWLETPCEVISLTEAVSSTNTHQEPADSENTSNTVSRLTSLSTTLAGRDLTVPVLPPPYLCAEFCDEALQLSSLPYQNNCKLPSAASDIFNVTVTEAKVLTATDAVKKTLLLRLLLEDNKMTYSPGDALSIICPNSSSEVDLLIQRLGLEDVADQKLSVTVLSETKKRRAAVPAHIHPTGSTLRHVLTTCLSLRDPPSKAFLRALVEYTTDECEHRRLQELCSKEGAAEYTQCLRQGQVSLLDLLYAFPSCSPPVETLLEHLPRLQPRPYSACSCQEVTPQSLDIAFNVVEVKAAVSEGHFYHRRGVCTGWLDDITSGLQHGGVDKRVQIPVFLRTNQYFRPPADLSRPLIMIGPGTGVAPFIGFLESRSLACRQQQEDGAAYGETLLYFGCRNEEKDFLFRDKLEEFEDEGVLTKLKVTFSRDRGRQGFDEKEKPAAAGTIVGNSGETQTASGPIRYVQDKMRQDAKALVRLIAEQDALVYVCGDANNMAADVSAAFEDILQKEKGLSKDDAHMFVMKKRIHKTYLEDVWA